MKINHGDGIAMSDEQVRFIGESFQEGFRKGLIQAKIMVSMIVYEKKRNQLPLELKDIEFLYERLSEESEKF